MSSESMDWPRHALPAPCAARTEGGAEHRVILEDAPQQHAGQALEPNLAEAERFLTLLDEEAEQFTFVTFDDDSSRKDRGLTRELTGTFEQHAAELASRNRAGAGVFVTINATDGRGRKAENVTRVRAVFVDLDCAPLEPVLDCALEPHLVVETSPRRYHAYWLVQGAPLDEFSAVQAAIAKRFGGDAAVKDLSRVMRLPGIYHRKVKPDPCRTGEPFMVRIVHESGAQRLPWVRVREAFPPVRDAVGALPTTVTAAPVVIDPTTQAELRSALASLRADDRDLWVRMGMALEELGDIGRGLWIEWSQGSDKYDAADANRVWDSLNPEHTGYQAVFAAAQRHGWLNPLSARAQIVAAPEGRPDREEAPAPWPEPLALPSMLLPVDPFDRDLLPTVLRPWVADIAERMQCPADFPAVGAMVALSSVVGRKACIAPKRHDDWRVMPNLWGLVVGRPGVMKSPALAEVLRPLDRLALKANEAYQAALRDYEVWSKVQEFTAEADEKKAKAAAGKGNRAEAERLLRSAADAKLDREQPSLRRYKVTDATVEALGEILIENPWGVLAYRDELNGLLRSLDKEGQEGARSFYLQGYDGNQGYTFDRILRGRNLHIPAVCIAVLGSMQPGRLQAYIHDAVTGGAGDDGLLQRFGLLVWPDIDGGWVNVDRFPNTPARRLAFEAFERLDALPPGTDPETGEPAPAVYRFEGDAQAEFDVWREEFEVMLRSGERHPALESHLAKYRKLVPALALVCAVADGESVVSVISLRRALAWVEYLASHAARAYGAGTRPATEGARALLDKMRGGRVADGFAARDVYLKGWTHLNTPESVHAAAQVLCDLHHLRKIERRRPEGGRPSTTYRINPATWAGG
jgi:putative DNA primase/helicase